MKKILIIEDNFEVRDNLAEILGLSNYQVFTAENGKIGVEKATAELPDLIICDVMMPELDGLPVPPALTTASLQAQVCRKASSRTEEPFTPAADLLSTVASPSYSALLK